MIIVNRLNSLFKFGFIILHRKMNTPAFLSDAHISNSEPESPQTATTLWHHAGPFTPMIKTMKTSTVHTTVPTWFYQKYKKFHCTDQLDAMKPRDEFAIHSGWRSTFQKYKESLNMGHKRGTVCFCIISCLYRRRYISWYISREPNPTLEA